MLLLVIRRNRLEAGTVISDAVSVGAWDCDWDLGGAARVGSLG